MIGNVLRACKLRVRIISGSFTVQYKDGESTFGFRKLKNL
jgi:hypothetical protein